MALLFVFQVKYFKSNVMAKKIFTSSTNMETTFNKIKSKNEQSEIIAEVFPVNQLTFRTA